MKHIARTQMLAAMALSALTLTAQPKLTADNVSEVIAAMTVEEKIDLLIGCGMAMGEEVKFPGTAGRTRDIPRLGIESAYLADGPHRLHMTRTRDWDSQTYICTELPSETNVAASFDIDAAYQLGEVIGAEVRDFGLDVLLAPGVNLMRSALCGRNNEYYSEDPVLAGKIAAGFIRGIQDQGSGTCLKHFAINNQETNRNNNDSRLSQRAIRELYLKNFEIAVKESNPWSIMTSYNRAQGLYTCENRELTETILRDEWGWNGLVMSDWNAGKDAVASIKAGNDMLQPGQPRQREALLNAAKDGTLPMELIDLSVRRTLEFVLKCHTPNGYVYPNETDLKGHAKVVRQLGAESMVLLKNDPMKGGANNVLPLNGVSNLALYGCTSYDMVPAAMGFGGTNVGPYCVSLVEAARKAGMKPEMSLARFYKKHIADEDKKNYPDGRPPFSITAPLRAGEWVPEADVLAENVKKNDVAIITLGRTSGEGADRKREHFFLTDAEKNLINTVAEAYHQAGKPVILVLNVCGPIETAPISDKVDAILCAFEPGQECGNSVMDVLTGKVNPSGRLPMTWQVAFGDAPADQNFPADYVFDMSAFRRAYSGGSAKDAAERAQRQAEPVEVKDVDYTVYAEDIYVGYRYFDTYQKPVSFPFGFGLSYTTFGYEIVSSAIDGDKCQMEVKVTNTGKVAGREVVQAYVKAPKGRIDKPSKELKAFGKTRVLKPGESQTLVLTWNTMDMASFDEKASAWVLDKGQYQFMAAASSADVRATATQRVAKARTEKVHNVMAPKQKITRSPMLAKK
ncbi:MAG: glycoside hydrolase family 3 C-terminal domain-containing protein [Bacteroidales bacterium]|nr:glycoside hydrolase family 3 C-terminal domain-containing protein [Bacteroidales bacterium]